MNKQQLLHQATTLLQQLPDGDLARVLAFAQAVHQQRYGKREKRRARFQKPEVEGWRVGE